ncbi:MAG: bestrophin family protein [Prochlorothrix sp.]
MGTNNDRHWFRLIFNLTGSVIPGIFTDVLLITSFSVLITVADYQGIPVAQESLSTLIPELVLGLLLVFRTDTAYGHFWDGSGVISDIVDLCRGLARSIWVYVDAEDEETQAEKLNRTIVVALFLAAVKQHLRGEKLDDSMRKYLTPEQAAELEAVNNMPVRMTQWLSNYLKKVYQQGKITDQLFSQMNEVVNQMTLGMGSCERILTTPLPRPYAIHLKHLLLIYFALVPFKLVGMFHLLTPIAVALLAFALLGIEEVGREIENPFGYDDDDLPLDQQADELLMDVQEIIGAKTH